jgi:hypothetical protein
VDADPLRHFLRAAQIPAALGLLFVIGGCFGPEMELRLLQMHDLIHISRSAEPNAHYIITLREQKIRKTFRCVKNLRAAWWLRTAKGRVSSANLSMSSN